MKLSDVEEYQRFMADLVSSSQAAMEAGKTVDEAFAAFSLAKYPGYNNERGKGPYKSFTTSQSRQIRAILAGITDNWGRCP